MVRPSSVDNYGMKKGAWSQEEDNKLRDYIQRYSHWNWRLLPKYAGLSRCGKSCRLRWVNYLKPGIKRGKFTKNEEELIIGSQSKIGNKWSAIAARLPGRTDNEIKNFWHSQIKKRKGKRRLIPYSTNTVNANSIRTDDHQKYDGELGLGYDQMDNVALINLESNSSSYSIDDELEELEFGNDYRSFPADKTYTQNNQNHYFPPDEEFFDYPELYNNELSNSSNSSYMSATATSLDWITDDDNSTIISSDHRHSVLDDQHINAQCDGHQINFMLPHEVGAGNGGTFYDHSFPYFDDGILFNLY